MSDKGFEQGNKKMSLDYVAEARSMAEVILQKVHRGPGDTIDAAMFRAEQKYGVPSSWLHRLRYREIKDMPVSAYGAVVQAYMAATSAAERAYEHERELADARNSKLIRLADFVAGKKA